MSYYICLTDPKTSETLRADTPMRITGANIAVGGTPYFEVSITYNYGKFYRLPETFGPLGIRALYGLSAAESIPMLERAISALAGKPSDDYWEACPGNARAALVQLLTMARMRPDGIWYGD